MNKPKKMKKVLSFVFALTFLASALTLPAAALRVTNASGSVIGKCCESGKPLSFLASDFSEIAGSSVGFAISTLPASSVGVLKIGEKSAAVGDTVLYKDIADLKFEPAVLRADETTVFKVLPVLKDGSSVSTVAVAVDVKAAPNYAPVAENVNAVTYRNVAIEGSFGAVDPEGDLVNYTLVSEPKKGVVDIIGNKFVYTPANNRSGHDSFTYVATDAVGNVSSEAEVQVLISKQKTSVNYSDMDGNSAHYAALVLAENDVCVGKKLGETYFFGPNETVTRAEFLAMCLRTCGMDKLSDVKRTGFADDQNIPVWAKPYVSSAVLSGIISGYKSDSGTPVFSANTPITFAEAAVMLNNILKISNVTGVNYALAQTVPTWAYQATVNLASCDILPSDASIVAGGSLNRGDVAEMLCGALKLIDERGGKSLLSWAK